MPAPKGLARHLPSTPKFPPIPQTFACTLVVRIFFTNHSQNGTMQSQEEKVGFEDRFVILLKMRLNGAAELRY
jgi:hypothetical protein